MSRVFYSSDSCRVFINPSPWQEIIPVLPASIRSMITGLPLNILEKLEEIRLRQNRPLILGLADGDILLDNSGKPAAAPRDCYLVTADDIQRVTQLISGCSLYAFEEELKNGFITLPGGHRVGLTGKTVLENGRVRTLKYISGLNIRISREVKGAASPLLPFIIDQKSGSVLNTLIFSPPRCGKTTILRDVIRQLSNGIPELNFRGAVIGVVDERSELAGCFQGVPQREVGIRTDILDGCRKAEGMFMLLRSMAPRVIATDEIGTDEDFAALEGVFNAGVKVLTTVHAASFAELNQRPALRNLLNMKVIARFVLLGRSKNVGTIEEIIDGRTMLPLPAKEVEQCLKLLPAL
ncbi:MAG: Stage III sporulation protein AA [Desulfofundulus kuznetsovii]|nr:MAG: Stage III sporulation protein AA [Desulfotomaculum sp. 46_80]KUK85093.1 MAG: Stage III sporulation protein AA [Desulfofundulus kuznetsovii]